MYEKLVADALAFQSKTTFSVRADSGFETQDIVNGEIGAGKEAIGLASVGSGWEGFPEFG